jgi:hypothetical protein
MRYKIWRNKETNKEEVRKVQVKKKRRNRQMNVNSFNALSPWKLDFSYLLSTFHTLYPHSYVSLPYLIKSSAFYLFLSTHSRSQWPGGLSRICLEHFDLGFESHSRHGNTSAYFCVLLSCIGKRSCNFPIPHPRSLTSMSKWIHSFRSQSLIHEARTDKWVYEGRLKCSWTHLITPSRNFV